MSTVSSIVPRDTGTVDADNPWPGLASFREDDRAFFRGRESEIEELHRLVRRERLTVVFGHSGLGKTSLLQAGLFPRLREDGAFPVYIRLDHTRSGAPLREQVEGAILSQARAAEVEPPAPGVGETLWEYFNREDSVFWSRRNRPVLPVLVFDQFEEIFTLGKETPDRAAASTDLLVELGDLVEGRPPAAVAARLEADPSEAARFTFSRQHYKVLLTLREDFLAELEALRDRIPSIGHNRMRLRRMTGEQATDVVGQTEGRLVAGDAVEPIVRFVAGPTAEGKPLHDASVDPALLSVFCRELNNKRAQLGQPRITTALLEGSWAEILTDFYEHSLADQPPEVRTFIEENLLTVSGFRDSVALENALTTPGVTEPAIRALVDRRLLRLDELAGIRRLELAHDVLTDVVRSSRDTRREREERAAAERARLAAEERERHMQTELRRSRRTSVLLAGLALLAIAGAAWGFVAQRQASRAQIEAQGALADAVEARQQSERARADAELARQATERALSAQQTARADAVAARDSLALAIRSAQESFELAVTTADRLASELLAPVRHDMRVPTTAVREVIEIIDGALASLAASPEGMLRYAEFLAVAGDTYVRLGWFDDGLAAATRALALLDSIADHGDDPERIRLTRAEAHHSAGAGLLARGRLSDAHAELSRALELVDGNGAVGSVHAARILVDVHSTLAALERARRRYATARTHARAIAAVADAAGDLVDDATRQDWRALAIATEGSAYVAAWDYEAALPLYTRAAEKLAGLRARDPENLRLTARAAELDYWLAFTRMRLVGTVAGHELTEADRDLLRAAEAAVRNLGSQDPDNLEWRLLSASVLRGIGMMHAQDGDWPGAELAFESGVAATAGLLEVQPGWQRARYQHAAILIELTDLGRSRYHGSPQRDRRFLEQAAARVRDALEVAQRAAADAPEDLEGVRGLALAQSWTASIHEDLGDSEQAWAASTAATRTFERLRRQSRGDPNLLEDVRLVLVGHSRRVSDPDDSTTKRDLLERARAIAEELVAGQPSHRNLYSLAVVHNDLGLLMNAADEPDAALAHYAAGVEAVDRAIAEFGPRPDLVRLKGRFLHRNRARVLTSLGDHEAALDELEHAIDAWHLALGDAWADSTYVADLLLFASDAEPIEQALQERGTTDAAVVAQLLERVRSLRARADPDRYLPLDAVPAWPLPPLLPGAWRTLNRAERTDELALIRAASDDPRLRDRDIGRVRKLGLNFYEDAALFEAEITDVEPAGIINYIRSGRDVVVLDGDSHQLHELNRTAPLRVGTIDQAAAYLRLFVHALATDRGRFHWADHVDELPWVPDATTAQRDSVRQVARPLVIDRDPAGGWRALGSTIYAGHLYSTIFRLYPDGVVLMVADQLMRGDIPLRTATFTDAVRSRVEPVATSRRPNALGDLGVGPADIADLRVLGRAQTVSGQLGEGRLAGGHYHYAPWAFHAEADESASFALRSDEFDAFLYLFDAETGELIASDDDGLEGTDSLIRITFPHTRTYILAAGSFGEHEHGAYTLEHYEEE